VFCETLLSRLSLIESENTVPGELSEAISTIIYAAPRLGVEELHQITQQLSVKFGAGVVDDALHNRYYQVNSTVVDGLAAVIPDEEMVREYMRLYYAKNEPPANIVPSNTQNTYTAPYIPSAPPTPLFVPPENPELNDYPPVNTTKSVPPVNTEDPDTSRLYPSLGNPNKKIKRESTHQDEGNNKDKADKNVPHQDEGDDDSWLVLQARLEALRRKL